MLANLCNEKGECPLGSDSRVWMDGRFSISHQLYEVAKYRESFRKNFPHKAEEWTHCFFTKNLMEEGRKMIRKIPKTGEKNERMYRRS